MLLAITAVDYGVLALYLVAMVAIGAYFSRQQKTSQDFFLAGRSMSWFPVGLSVMATLLSALSYSGIPGAGYYFGLKFILMPVAVWLTLPVLVWLVLPLYQGLKLYSVYEYLELRFDASTRYLGSLLFVLWRLLWLGGVLYAPCKVLVAAAGLDIPMWVLLLVLGLVSTGYTFLGGMKAVIWTDVIQAIVMVGGLVLIIGSVWMQLDGGHERIWQVTRGLGRDQAVEPTFDWTKQWPIWGILPHFAISMLSFYVADQITAQRFLTAKSLKAARQSFVLNCVSVSIMVPALAYLGIALLAYYHDHPEEVKPEWVVNLDNSESPHNKGTSITSGGKQAKPLIDSETDRVDKAAVDQLIAERRLLHPNSKEPFESPDEVVDRLTGEIKVENLMMRLPPPADGSLRRGEIVLHKNAQDQLMPHFITRNLALGVAGLILAALFAASMSSMDSGLNSICTLLIMDFHRRLGWGRAWLAGRLNKPIDQLDEADELRLARPLVLIIGLAATVFSLGMVHIDSIWDIMVKIVNTVGGPLLAVFLLGIVTRRATAKSALIALISGTVFTICLILPSLHDGLDFLWPKKTRPNGIWMVVFSTLFTFAVGYLLSFAVGRRKSKQELRGLVFGIGTLGQREPKKDDTKIEIDDQPDDKPEQDERWK